MPFSKKPFLASQRKNISETKGVSKINTKNISL